MERTPPRHKIEALSAPSVLLVWIIFLGAVVLSVITGAIVGGAIDVKTYNTVAFPQEQSPFAEPEEDFRPYGDFFHGHQISFAVSNIQPQNQDLVFNLEIRRRSNSSLNYGFSLQYELNTTVRKLKAKSIPYRINCFEGGPVIDCNSTDKNPTHTKGYEGCTNCIIPLAHYPVLEALPPSDQRSSEAGDYSISIKCVETKKEDGEHVNEKCEAFHSLLSPVLGEGGTLYSIHLSVSYGSEQFTNAELGMRMTLCFISIMATFAFYGSNRRYHKFVHWSLEQKWVFILLCSVAMFDDPLFILSLYNPNVMLSTLHAFFKTSFFCVYLLCLLLFIDNLYKPHRKLSNALFYYPKVGLVGVLWFVGIASFIAIRVTQDKDPRTADLMNVELSGIKVFMIFAGVILTIYGVWLLGLICLVLNQWSNDTTTWVPGRVKFLWCSAVLMLIPFAVGFYSLVLIENDQMRAPEFYFFYSLYNFYIYLLAYMYFPTGPVIRRHTMTSTAPGSTEVDEEEVDSNLIFDEDDV